MRNKESNSIEENTKTIFKAFGKDFDKVVIDFSESIKKEYERIAPDWENSPISDSNIFSRIIDFAEIYIKLNETDFNEIYTIIKECEEYLKKICEVSGGKQRLAMNV